VIKFVHLNVGEQPGPEKVWLLIVKTHDRDHELIISRDAEATTLGAYSTLEEAQDDAAQIASSQSIEVVYLIVPTT
jgi:hypothetical protein